MVISKSSSQTKVNKEKQAERELWLKLVVKVISWKDGSSKTVGRISEKEWDVYYHRMIKTNTSWDREKVVEKLNSTKESIKKHGGFEKGAQRKR